MVKTLVTKLRGGFVEAYKEKMKHLATVFLIILTISSSCLAQTTVEKKVDSGDFQNYVSTILTEYKIPAIQAALISGNDILNLTAVGVDKIGGESISQNSKMHLGSCGKAITGYLAAILVEKGLLNWDTNIEAIFPEFKGKTNNQFLDLNLKELLSHQTQIPQFITDEDWKLLDRFVATDPQIRRYNFAEWILQKEAVPFDSAEMEAGFRYSNAGYSIAAAMMEKVTGTRWEQLMEQEVFGPLEIEAIFGWPATTDKTQPFGHIIDEKSEDLIPHNPNDNYQIDAILSPAGNLSMSIVDYSKFIQKNLNGLNGFDKEYPKEFFEFLHYVNKPISEYSIGWYSVNQFDDDLSSHTGSADTFYCLNLLLRKHNIAVIVIANSATEQTKAGMEKVRNYLIRPYLMD